MGVKSPTAPKSTKNSTESDRLNFFFPIEIEKGKKGEKKAMRIKGVASTKDIDSDQEVLEPTGFILDQFLKAGFFNYNHKSNSDPTCIVGEPDNAYITNGELVVEGFLYPDSQKALDLYNTIDVLSKNSNTRKMGMSIEGRALERDPFNKKRITKALITGCAITPTPKNSRTLVEVIKGEASPYEEPIYEASDSNGGTVSPYIIDIVGDDGYRRTVDKDLNIVIRKMDIQAYSPVMPESVAGTKRKGKKEIDPFGSDKIEKKLSKSESFEYIFANFTTDIPQAKRIYDLMCKIEQLKKA